MPLECATIIGLECVESNVGKLGPQQRDKIQAGFAPAAAEELAHQPLRTIPSNRTSEPTRGDDPQPASVQTVRKREQGQVAATHARALPLHAEKLPAPSNPVTPGQSPIHVPHRRGRPLEDSCTSLDGKALPAFRAAPPQNFPAGLRAHALAKPVRSLAPPVVRLIRALHALIIPAGCRRRQTRHQTD